MLNRNRYVCILSQMILTNINFFHNIDKNHFNTYINQSFKHNVLHWSPVAFLSHGNTEQEPQKCPMHAWRSVWSWVMWVNDVKMIFSWPGVGVWSGEAWWHEHLYWYSACPAPAAHWHSYTLGWRCEYKIWYRTKLSSVSVEQCPCNNTCRLRLPSWMLRLVFRRFSGMEKLTN